MEHPSTQDIYQMIRSQVEHEDRLVDQKVNWLLVGQGFLFVAYTGLIASSNPPKNLVFAILIISFTAIFVNLFSLVGIGASYFHMERLKRFWESLMSATSESDKNIQESRFPPIMGTGKWIKGGYGSVAIPIIMTIAWTLIVIFTIL